MSPRISILWCCPCRTGRQSWVACRAKFEVLAEFCRSIFRQTESRSKMGHLSSEFPWTNLQIKLKLIVLLAQLSSNLIVHWCFVLFSKIIWLLHFKRNLHFLHLLFCQKSNYSFYRCDYSKAYQISDFNRTDEMTHNRDRAGLNRLSSS